MAWNVNGIKNQFYEFQECILLHQPAIAIVTETKLSAKVKSLFNIQGFSAIRQDRPKPKGGGISMYINKKVSYHKLNLKTNDPEPLQSRLKSITKFML